MHLSKNHLKAGELVASQYTYINFFARCLSIRESAYSILNISVSQRRKLTLEEKMKQANRAAPFLLGSKDEISLSVCLRVKTMYALFLM